LRHLHDLAVGAPRDVRRLLEAGVLVLADQLDPVSESRRVPGRSLGSGGRRLDDTRRFAVRRREDLCLLLRI
jgi:hypothetical protein